MVRRLEARGVMRVIDSHTEGEPTRLIVDGGPDLGDGPLSERRRLFAERRDDVRRFVLSEPRGFDAMVGALLTTPVDPGAAAGLIFFNNAGFLGMCGHATIGAAVTLHHMGRIGLGRHRFETPVGVVSVELSSRNEATIDNVPSYVFRRGVELPGGVTGDIAWGGNWFFLTGDAPCPLEPRHIPRLTAAALSIKAKLKAGGWRGGDGGEIDHVEFFESRPAGGADSRNFVLCPGGAYDRSPCGTGTSAKLACLAAAGKLEPGALWVQESIFGSRFQARYRPALDGRILPSLTGRAYVTAETLLVSDPADPFPEGLPAFAT
jgi:4-hydroxyproline epimerase